MSFKTSMVCLVILFVALLVFMLAVPQTVASLQGLASKPRIVHAADKHGVGRACRSSQGISSAAGSRMRQASSAYSRSAAVHT